MITAYVINGKKELNSRGFHRIYDLSFEAWHKTWEKTYSLDFHSSDKLASDEFTRQDEILCLFSGNECAALCFFSNVNMNDQSALLDSYFQCWPEDAIAGLVARGSSIIICSQFTVCENFRKTGAPELGNSPWKILLIGMLCKYFMASGKDGMTGTTRVNKGVEKLTYQFGAIPLVRSMEYNAGSDTTLVDLVAFFQDNVYKAYYNYEFAGELDELWENRNAKRLKIAA
ncbi:MAG: hypothetical protein WC635_09760 [Bacteriovorax sp.]